LILVQVAFTRNNIGLLLSLGLFVE